MKHCVLIVIVLLLLAPVVRGQDANALQLDEVEVIGWEPIITNATPQSLFYDGALQAMNVESPKDLSVHIPNFFVPDYGSAITSTIYIRGLGARIDQPVMGLELDGIPIMDKNLYDFDLLNVDVVQLMRGPQSTLFGRNTLGGLMHIGIKRYDNNFSLGYGNRNSLRLQMTHNWRYRTTLNLGASHTDGFYTNHHDNSHVGRTDNVQLHLRQRLLNFPSSQLFLDNILWAGYLRQDGYAYARQDQSTGRLLPIAYNDPCGYERFHLVDGLKLRYNNDAWELNTVMSYQLLLDDMHLDQDFTTDRMFTLRQQQRQHSFTLNASFSSASPTQRNGYHWLTGLWAFAKMNHMDAPVTFLQDGIDSLILANANNMLPGSPLMLQEESFVVGSDFRLLNHGQAVYHQSTYKAGRWTFLLGLRLDHEQVVTRFNSEAVTHYIYKGEMGMWKELRSTYDGTRRQDFWQLLPRLSVSYQLPADHHVWYFTATAAKGYKAGGFNTQIFSTILQNRLMNDLIGDLSDLLAKKGVYPSPDTRYTNADIALYKPEHAWNYELGTRFAHHGRNSNAEVRATAFYTDCRDQQLTIFPEGKTTGRMMTNAGRTRSLGTEWEASAGGGWKGKKNSHWIQASAAYGLTDARFVDYADGRGDFSHNRVPYAPMHTLSLQGHYRIEHNKRSLAFNLGWQLAGPIYWDEANLHRQDAYGQLQASVSARLARWTLNLWGRNLTNTRYNTFYFVSMGNTFYQQGKPLRVGVTVSYKY